MAAVSDNVDAAAGNPVAASPLVGVVNKVFLQIKRVLRYPFYLASLSHHFFRRKGDVQ
jgi:hypothetical protein